jgi:pullulanase
MCRKFILDSLKYWVTEFGVDGFRFDLMGLMGMKALTLIRDELRAIHPSILLYGEPWTAGATGLRKPSDKHAVAGSGIAAFNDHYRNAIKGDPDGPLPGFMQAGDRVDAVKLGIRGGIHDWATHPADSINYIECHDNLTAWDKLLVSAPDATDDERRRMQRLAALLIVTSQGIPFLHCGQEFCRTKQGHHNSYNMPDAINQVDWSAKRANRDVFEYVRGLIALRKAHPVFRLQTREEVERRVHLMDDVPSPKCIAYALDGRDVFGESFSTVLILINGDFGEHTFPTGPGRWLLTADADRVRDQAIREVRTEITVPPHSGVILHK